jgi:hypothetical protein
MDVSMEPISKLPLNIIQKINDKYVIIFYTSVINSEEIMNSNPFIDAIVTVSHDNNTTIFKLKLMRDNEINFYDFDSNGDYDLENDTYIYRYDGIHSYLQYRTINDHGFLKLLRNKINATITIQKHLYTYALMKTSEIKKEWLGIEFMDFIKRKNNDSTLIIFEKPNDEEIKYDNQTGNIIFMKDYIIIFNDKSQQKDQAPIHQLQYNLCNNDRFLCITSPKEFDEIFKG